MSFDVEHALRMPPLYSLNLSSAQRSTLSWLEENGAVFSALAVSADEIAEDCKISASTVYEALSRLTSLHLVIHENGMYKINPRYFFAMNPLVRSLVGSALEAPEVTPDSRALRPRKVSNADARRRQVVRPAS